MRDDDAELKKRRDALLAATAPSDQKSSEELLLRKRVEELTQENARLKQPSPTTTNEYGDLALKYDALRREYKLYRANALKALQEQKALAADAAKGLQLADLGRRKPAGNVRENDQMAYLKNLMAQYLVCGRGAEAAHGAGGHDGAWFRIRSESASRRSARRTSTTRLLWPRGAHRRGNGRVVLA